MDYHTWKRRQEYVKAVEKHPLGAGWRRSSMLSDTQLHSMDAMGVAELTEAGYLVTNTANGWQVSLHMKHLATGSRLDSLGFGRGDYFSVGPALVRRDTAGIGAGRWSFHPDSGGPKV